MDLGTFSKQKRGAEAPLKFNVEQDILFIGELRIGFEATFSDIHTFVLFFFTNPDTHDHLDDTPGDQASAK